MRDADCTPPPEKKSSKDLPSSNDPVATATPSSSLGDIELDDVELVEIKAFA